MGVRRIHGRSIRREDLADSGLESIKRDSSGAVQFTQVGTASATGVSGTATSTVTQTQTGRHFVSNATVKVTEATAGTATVTLKRGAATVKKLSGITTTTSFTTQNTFTSTGITWSLVVDVAAGKWTANWTQSVEAAR